MDDQFPSAGEFALSDATRIQRDITQLKYDLQKLKIAFDQQSEILLKLHSVINHLISRIVTLEKSTGSKMP